MDKIVLSHFVTSAKSIIFVTITYYKCYLNNDYFALHKVKKNLKRISSLLYQGCKIFKISTFNDLQSLLKRSAGSSKNKTSRNFSKYIIRSPNILKTKFQTIQLIKTFRVYFKKQDITDLYQTIILGFKYLKIQTLKNLNDENVYYDFHKIKIPNLIRIYSMNFSTYNVCKIQFSK